NKTLKHNVNPSTNMGGLKYFRINKTLKRFGDIAHDDLSLKYFRINKTLKPQILTVSMPRQGC
ncbi:hypothetical protein, partial [uncultured Allobaculum sp.]|uniref:hypothetical protein n=1 Tax=uncultured Allobaculum sp. TaxID=1187017 RepID=UPI0026F289BF